jgi:hypothetical protein
MLKIDAVTEIAGMSDSLLPGFSPLEKAAIIAIKQFKKQQLEKKELGYNNVSELEPIRETPKNEKESCETKGGR